MISRQLIAEVIGTFALVFAGTGAIIANDVSGGAVTHPGIALTFGLVVMAMIYAVGDISGAHLNPAVSCAFWIARRFPGKMFCRILPLNCWGLSRRACYYEACFPITLLWGALYLRMDGGSRSCSSCF